MSRRGDPRLLTFPHQLTHKPQPHLTLLTTTKIGPANTYQEVQILRRIPYDQPFRQANQPIQTQPHFPKASRI